VDCHEGGFPELKVKFSYRLGKLCGACSMRTA